MTDSQDKEDPIPHLIKNSEDIINAINYILMRLNRLEDRINIHGYKAKEK